MQGEPTPVYRFLRARTYIYFAVISVLGGLMVYQLATRTTLVVAAIHDRQPLFTTLADGSIRNGYTVRIMNKRPEARGFAITVDGPLNAKVEIVGNPVTADWRPIVEVGPDQTREVRMIVSVPRENVAAASMPITVRASDLFVGEVAVTKDNFFGPAK